MLGQEEMDEFVEKLKNIAIFLVFGWLVWLCFHMLRLKDKINELTGELYDEKKKFIEFDIDQRSIDELVAKNNARDRKRNNDKP